MSWKVNVDCGCDFLLWQVNQVYGAGLKDTPSPLDSDSLSSSDVKYNQIQSLAQTLLTC